MKCIEQVSLRSSPAVHSHPGRAVLLTLKNCNIVYNKYMHSASGCQPRLRATRIKCFSHRGFSSPADCRQLTAVCSLLKNYIIWHFFLFISSGSFFSLLILSRSIPPTTGGTDTHAHTHTIPSGKVFRVLIHELKYHFGGMPPSCCCFRLPCVCQPV